MDVTFAPTDHLMGSHMYKGSLGGISFNLYKTDDFYICSRHALMTCGRNPLREEDTYLVYEASKNQSTFILDVTPYLPDLYHLVYFRALYANCFPVYNPYAHKQATHTSMLGTREPLVK